MLPRLLFRRTVHCRTARSPCTALKFSGTLRYVPSTLRCLATSSSGSDDPRSELREILLRLEKHAPGQMSEHRLRLALRNLRQEPGRETVRIAVLGLGGDVTAKNVLGLLLADPLVSREDWEEALARTEAREPVIVRAGVPEEEEEEEEAQRERVLSIREPNAPRQIHAPVPWLRHRQIEFLAMEATETNEEAVLVPDVRMPIPGSPDRLSSAPTPTPVHCALLVTAGIRGAAKLATLPFLQGDGKSVAAAVHLPLRVEESLPFWVVDVDAAGQALDLFRKGPEHAIQFERLWNGSNMAALVTWIRSNAHAHDGTTKPAVRRLISSLLQDASANQQMADDLRGLPTAVSPPDDRSLTAALGEWAQKAHAELQDELDRAFSGRRWRKLGWWKLFWRVDDVGLLTGEILATRLLPTAEQGLVYLAGRIREGKGEAPLYSQPLRSRSLSPTSPGTATEAAAEGGLSGEPSAPPDPRHEWPTHVAFARTYLTAETIPALQALAQKLVLQALATSGLMTALSGLVYASSTATTLYEAGAVAALGVAFGLLRMQRKWEAAREFWEGEVREEGRKAVRAAERSVAGVLNGKETDTPGAGEENSDARKTVAELVVNARDALARMR